MKRVSIVFAETDDNHFEQGQGFTVFLEGLEPDRKKLPEDQLTAAEFWAIRCLAIIVGIMGQAPALKSVERGS